MMNTYSDKGTHSIYSHWDEIQTEVTFNNMWWQLPCDETRVSGIRCNSNFFDLCITLIELKNQNESYW